MQLCNNKPTCEVVSVRIVLLEESKSPAFSALAAVLHIKKNAIIRYHLPFVRDPQAGSAENQKPGNVGHKVRCTT
jgi:hypothetical protein